MTNPADSSTQGEDEIGGIQLLSEASSQWYQECVSAFSNALHALRKPFPDSGLCTLCALLSRTLEIKPSAKGDVSRCFLSELHVAMAATVQGWEGGCSTKLDCEALVSHESQIENLRYLSHAWSFYFE